MSSRQRSRRATVKKPSFLGWATSDEDEMARRRERARTEKMTCRKLNPDQGVYGEYDITGASRRTYRVEIRALVEPINSCSCRDFQVNGLGTCKHIEVAVRRLSNRTRAGERRARPNTTLYQFAADGYLTYWLDRQGFSADTVTDEDLHNEGLSAIKDHRVVITGNHPEYWSTPMWDAMQGFLDAGGRLMYLGGNGFYWRIAYSDVFPGVIEVRRAEDGTRPWVSAPGEYRLSFTGEMSGLWRRNNRTPNQLVGVGMTAQGFDRGTYYRRNPDSFDERAAFIFKGVGDNELIGNFGFAFDGASGQEIDRYDHSLGSPAHALVVATSEGHGDNMLLVNEEFQSSHLMLGGTENPLVRSDMVFFETAAGGAVFSTGSISWISSLAGNDCSNNVSTITRNVLERFSDAAPFPAPRG